MNGPVWLDREALLVLHRLSLERFGGAPGLRDEGLFEAALARPQQIHAYQPEADVFDLAAGYAGGFVRNHAFVDGNKRAAFTACVVFLADNGWLLTAEQDEAASMVIALASREVAEDAFAAWLRRNAAPV